MGGNGIKRHLLQRYPGASQQTHSLQDSSPTLTRRPVIADEFHDHDDGYTDTSLITTVPTKDMTVRLDVELYHSCLRRPKPPQQVIRFLEGVPGAFPLTAMVASRMLRQRRGPSYLYSGQGKTLVCRQAPEQVCGT
jgi:hypothetical protein